MNPERITSNANATPGEVLVLNKPLGTGAIIAGQRLGEVDPLDYQAALDCYNSAEYRVKMGAGIEVSVAAYLGLRI